MNKLKIESLTKNFGKLKAVNDVTLELEPAKIYGLLGRNGAGKTTLLNLISNKLFPTQGTITLDGVDITENDEALNKIFFMYEATLYPMNINFKKLFKFVKIYYENFDIDYAFKLCDKFGLNANKKIKTLSTGYKTICKDILVLASGAEIMLFDEPVLGLDANHRELFYRELLEMYNEKPKTIVISTHLIDEIAEIIEEVIIINNGKIIVRDSVEKLLSQAYSVFGEANKVNLYLEGRKAIGFETLGNYKKATVLELRNEHDHARLKELQLETSKPELQKLFISLTE